MARKKKQKSKRRPKAKRKAKRKAKPKPEPAMVREVNKPNDPTITARDRRYRNNQKRDGFAHVRVFVPRDKAPVIRELALRLREGRVGLEFLHELVMQRIDELVKLDPPPETPDGFRLLELAGIMSRFESAAKEGTA